MFGPGVGTMPSAISAKASQLASGGKKILLLRGPDVAARITRRYNNEPRRQGLRGDPGA
jgi:hypothetical protein